MFNLVLEKPKEPEIKLLTSAGSSKKQESSRKTSASLTTPKPLTVWITTKCERDGNTRPPYLLPKKSACRSNVTVRTGHGKIDWFKIGKVYSKIV